MDKDKQITQFNEHINPIFDFADLDSSDPDEQICLPYESKASPFNANLSLVLKSAYVHTNKHGPSFLVPDPYVPIVQNTKIIENENQDPLVAQPQN